MAMSRKICNFGADLVYTISKTYQNIKRRYAYLVHENVGNFHRIQGWHGGSHAIAWAAISISVSWAFPTAFM